MKKYILMLTAAFCSIASLAQIQDKQEPYSTRSLASDNIQYAEVQTSGGSISVMGVSTAEAKIEVYVSTNNGPDKNALTKEEIKKRLDENYELNISVANNKVTAIAKPKERDMDWKRGLSISFKIYIPQNASTNLRTSGGSISLKHLSGEQDFATSGGSLHVEEMSGKIKGRTSGGSIHVSNSKDDIDLATSGGSIHADNCSGNLRLATSGGSLNLTELKGTIKANTSGGSVHGDHIGGELSTHTLGGSIELSDLTCSLETSTSGGHIEVSIKEFGKFVKISNSSGSVDLQIPENKGADLNLSGRRVKTTSLNNFSGSTDEDEIRGKLNGGGTPVTVNAGNGNVKLSFK